MAHSNSTTNYSLPQFISTDKPAWLTDINTAYSDIDTGMHNAQVAADSAQSDATQALTTAGEASTSAAAADAKGSGAIASIATAFDTTATYNVNDNVIYNNLLYRCSVAVINPGPWSGSANWERITIDGIIPRTSEDISYNNTQSHLSATNPQNAIDEIVSYSTSERIVGSWIDGTPLYEKTIEVNNPTPNVVTDYDVYPLYINTDNAKNVFAVSGFFYRQDNRCISLPYDRPYQPNQKVTLEAFCDPTSHETNITITKPSAYNITILKAVVTIRYTK